MTDAETTVAAAEAAQAEQEQQTQAPEPLSLKGSLFTLTVLQLVDTDLDTFTAQVEATVEQSPKFFENAPFIIDLENFPQVKSTLKLAKVVEVLRNYGILPIGIRAGNEKQEKQAMKLHLAPFPSTKSPQQELELEKARPESQDKQKPTKSTPKVNKLVTQPVRSGQQIYAKGGDLIITASVSHGAEILADGNIHVYGPLRGRALAGVGGDETARIFCQGMEAELIAIAGHYLVRENAPEFAKDRLLQIYLDKEHLKIDPVFA